MKVLQNNTKAAHSYEYDDSAYILLQQNIPPTPNTISLNFNHVERLYEKIGNLMMTRQLTKTLTVLTVDKVDVFENLFRLLFIILFS